MTDKIIFWSYANIMYFGLAKYLHELYDCELFSIIDTTNKSKKFFQEQNIIKFKKFWFYHDHILKFDKKPDLKYLSIFEEKYKINLWLLAYNERFFFDYNLFHKFTSEQILSILENECRLFEEILDEINPDFLIMASPNHHFDYLFYHMCKIRGVKILIQGPSRFGGRCIISEKVDEIDSKKIPHIVSKKSFEELENYLKIYNITDEGKKLRKNFANSLTLYLKAGVNYLQTKNSNIKTHYTYFGRTKLKVILIILKYFFIEKYRKYFIDKHFVYDLNTKNPFVFFPLTTEPESTLLLYAPFFTDQLDLIRKIAKSLPIEYKLFIKDHPLQNIRGWRTTSFYKEIMKLPNVVMLHHTIPVDEIIKKSSLVITIASTAGMEAAFYQKPSIVFADVLYASLPSVHKLESITELPDVIRNSLQKKVNIDDLNKFLNYADENSFEFDLTEMDLNYMKQFFYGGYLTDVEISEKHIKSFLEDPNNREKFQLIANEHIKKIKQLKQSTNN